MTTDRNPSESSTAAIEYLERARAARENQGLPAVVQDQRALTEIRNALEPRHDAA